MGGQERGSQDVPVSTAESGVLAGVTPTLRPEDAAMFRSDTVITTQNFPSLLRAAGIGEEQIATIDCFAFVAAAAPKVAGRVTAIQVCEALRQTTEQAVVDRLKRFLERDSI